MIKSLRKKHLQAWSILAVMVPAGIISAYMVIQKNVTDRLWQPSGTVALPFVIKSVEKPNYTATIRSNKERSQYQLEWINKKASLLPSSLIYKIGKPENELIGRVDARGVYHFAIKTESLFNTTDYRLIVNDIIHHQTTDTINFLP